jgi:hypothetical protein
VGRAVAARGLPLPVRLGPSRQRKPHFDPGRFDTGLGVCGRNSRRSTVRNDSHSASAGGCRALTRWPAARDGKCWLGYSILIVSGDCCHYDDAPCEALDRRHLGEEDPYPRYCQPRLQRVDQCVLGGGCHLASDRQQSNCETRSGQRRRDARRPHHRCLVVLTNIQQHHNCHARPMRDARTSPPTSK